MWRKRFTWLAEAVRVDRNVLGEAIGTEWCLEEFPYWFPLLIGGNPPPYLRRVRGGFDVMLQVEVTPISRGRLLVGVPSPSWAEENQADFIFDSVVLEMDVDDVPEKLLQVAEAVHHAATLVKHEDKTLCSSCGRSYFGELVHPRTGKCVRCAFDDYCAPITAEIERLMSAKQEL